MWPNSLPSCRSRRRARRSRVEVDGDLYQGGAVANGSTVSARRRLDVRWDVGCVGARAAVEILARSGVRVSELCDLRIGEVRFHGSDGGRFQIVDSKTGTGVRELQMTPELTAVVGSSQAPSSYRCAERPERLLVQNVRRGRIDRGLVQRSSPRRAYGESFDRILRQAQETNYEYSLGAAA